MFTTLIMMQYDLTSHLTRYLCLDVRIFGVAVLVFGHTRNLHTFHTLPVTLSQGKDRVAIDLGEVS